MTNGICSEYGLQRDGNKYKIVTGNSGRIYGTAANHKTSTRLVQLRSNRDLRKPPVNKLPGAVGNWFTLDVSTEKHLDVSEAFCFGASRYCQARGPGLFRYLSTIASAVRMVIAIRLSVGRAVGACGITELPRINRFEA